MQLRSRTEPYPTLIGFALLATVDFISDPSKVVQAKKRGRPKKEQSLPSELAVNEFFSDHTSSD